MRAIICKFIHGFDGVREEERESRLVSRCLSSGLI